MKSPEIARGTFIYTACDGLHKHLFITCDNRISAMNIILLKPNAYEIEFISVTVECYGKVGEGVAADSSHFSNSWRINHNNDPASVFIDKLVSHKIVITYIAQLFS